MNQTGKQYDLEKRTDEYLWRDTAEGQIGFLFHLLVLNFDGFVKSPKMPFSVIPVKTGIQEIQALLDSRLSTLRSKATAEDGRGSDDCGDFLRMYQF